MKKITLFIVLITACLCFSFNNKCGTYRWSVKTMTDKEGEILLSKLPLNSSIDQLTNEPRNCPNRERDNELRYDDEKRVVRLEATINSIKLEGDNDFHLVLSASNKTMVGEVPNGDCSNFDKHPKLRAHFNDLRKQIIAAIGFTPTTKMKPVYRKVILEGVPFWDENQKGHKPSGSADNQHELHPITKIIFK